ncbi:hypothetical protein [Kribbella sancticallisti]
MQFYTPDSLQAEISWRQERITRDFQRRLWFQRRPAQRVKQQPCLPAVQARHAM